MGQLTQVEGLTIQKKKGSFKSSEHAPGILSDPFMLVLNPHAVKNTSSISVPIRLNCHLLCAKKNLNNIRP